MAIISLSIALALLHQSVQGAGRSMHVRLSVVRLVSGTQVHVVCGVFECHSWLIHICVSACKQPVVAAPDLLVLITHLCVKANSWTVMYCSRASLNVFAIDDRSSTNMIADRLGSFSTCKPVFVA